jgi:hypothetical protein
LVVDGTIVEKYLPLMAAPSMTTPEVTKRGEEGRLAATYTIAGTRSHQNP